MEEPSRLDHIRKQSLEDKRDDDIKIEDLPLVENEPKPNIVYSTNTEKIQKQKEVVKSKKLQDIPKANIEERPNPVLNLISFFFEILYTYILSMVPVWSDEFEFHNPIIEQPQQAQVNVIEHINHNEENSAINYNEEMERKIDQELKQELNINFERMNMMNAHSADNEMDDTSKERNIEHNLKTSINTDLDDPKNDQILQNKDTKHEKIVLQSSTDTKVVDSTSRKFNIFPDENRTENEFIFSENAMIDNISYNNESLLEINRKQKENKENSSEQHESI